MEDFDINSLRQNDEVNKKKKTTNNKDFEKIPWRKTGK